ncbi:MAG: hypothetical protein NZM31_13400 [Gemmatales bacterium]|nr:hypothetical protein [Gemmatales bacterium]MDW8387993.1 hypothetical protein [Gemmatales bacterium]
MSTYGMKKLTENRAPARDDAYTVMLSISLLAMIAACVILFYDLKRYPSTTPPAGFSKLPAAPQVTPPTDTQQPPPPADGTAQPANPNQPIP